MPALARFACLALLAGCTTVPVAPIPSPLPETLAWAEAHRPGARGGGAFLGLKTRENLVGGFDALDFRPGLHVTRVVESSPAARAGCRAGDVLLAFGPHPTDVPATLDALLAAAEPGEDVVLRVQRGDTVFEVPVVLDAPDDGLADDAVTVACRLDPARSRAAWLTGDGGVLLVASHDDAPFPRAGIPVGSLVRSVDGEEVLSDHALIRRLEAHEPGARIAVEAVGPGGQALTARVRLQDQPTKVTRVSVPVLLTYDTDVEGEETRFVLLDLWIVSLFRYERSGGERRWRVLRFFQFSSGHGELTE